MYSWYVSVLVLYQFCYRLFHLLPLFPSQVCISYYYVFCLGGQFYERYAFLAECRVTIRS